MANDHSVFKLLPQALARAYLNANQLNLTSGAWTEVDLDSESYDPGSNFNTTTHAFTAPIAGYYLVVGKITYTQVVADKEYVIGIYLNSALYALARSHSALASNLDVFFSDIVLLSKDDVVELYAWQNSGVNTVDVQGGADDTFLAIHLLSGT